MTYEFLSEFTLPAKEEAIDDVVNEQKIYAVLKRSPWTLHAQVLASGMAVEDEDFVTFLKNGRAAKENKGITAIKGYPETVRNRQVCLEKPWDSFFVPDHNILKDLPVYSCFMQLSLKLDRPFYSRDDRVFYPTENPLRREWVFHVPYLGAAGLKGLLRWSWRMCHGDDRQELERKIFGTRKEKLDEKDALQGCLYTWPLFWNGKIGLEVINPHSRETGAGDKPIKYEVVQSGAEAILSVLLFNRSWDLDDAKFLRLHLEPFLDALEFLVADNGLSAKRSADWGAVTVRECKAWLSGIKNITISPQSRQEEENVWASFTDEQGNLLPLESEQVFTTAILAKLTGESKTWVKKHKPEARQRVSDLWNQYKESKSPKENQFSQQGAEEEQPVLCIEENDLEAWCKRIREALAA